MAHFKGFGEGFFKFFAELKQNNNRDWFTENKPRYLQEVVEPMSAFITDMAPRLERISAHYRADPKPHGGSMFRIYRDTRFSKDKTPYKTHAACQFRHRAGKDAHAPGFYAHFELDRLMFGGGIWRPPGPHLNKIREFIADNPNEWSGICTASAVKKRGGIQGDSLIRPPRGFDADHPHIEHLKRKSFYLMAEADPQLMRSRALLNEVAAAFRASARLNHFICDAVGLPF